MRPAYLAPAIALTAQSPDEAGDDLARGPSEMPGDAAGLDGRPVGRQGRRTHRNRLCRGCQSGKAQGRRAVRGARSGAGRPWRAMTVVFAAGAVTGQALQPHYRDMESGASKAASARARPPARSGSGIPPPPSTAQGCSVIPPPPVTALASCSAIPPPPKTALASCSPIPPPPATALASSSSVPPPPETALNCSSIPPPPVTALASCSPIPPPPSIAHLAPANDRQLTG